MNIAHTTISIAACMASSALTALAVQNGAPSEANELVRCKRIEIVDGAGRTRIVLGDHWAEELEGKRGETFGAFGLTVLVPGQDDPAIAAIGGREAAVLRTASSTGFSADLLVIDDCAIFELSDGSGKQAVTRVTETSCELEMHHSDRGRLVLGGPNRPLRDEAEQRFLGLNVVDDFGNEAHFDARGVHGETLSAR